MNLPILVMFGIYFAVMLLIGFYFYKKNDNINDYLLGGRSLGSWVTAFSAQASDMSGWLLMGLPGALYLMGMNQSWIAIGLVIGTYVNWKLVAPRLRVYTEKTSSLTLPDFLGARFKDPTGLLRTISAIIILIFFTLYSSSGIVATGKLFESLFNMDYKLAVFVGAIVMIGYTFLGGYLAVCWTDLIQGALMVIAIIIVPVVAFFTVGGFEPISAAAAAKNVSFNLFKEGSSYVSILVIISTMAWGLGYFGQPHILARFMGIRSVKDFPKTIRIAMIWVVISLAGAVAIGLIGMAMFPDLSGGEEEKVFIYMITKLFNPWIGGILLAAILAAIMSTIDSQLLVSSSSLTEDFYKHLINKKAGEKELMWVGRICVLIISVVSLLLAMNPGNTILNLVAYAWGGFGAAFGPVIIMALFSKKTSWQSALAGMITGTLVLVVWKQMGLGSLMYEIVPGFVANFVVILLINIKFPCKSNVIHKQFDEVVKESK